MTEDDFSIRDYMSGKPLPITKEEAKDEVRKYFYGVYRTSRGKLTAFVSRKDIETIRRRFCLQGNLILVEKTTKATVGEIKVIANKLLEEFISSSTGVIGDGSIVDYCDGDGVHTAVVLYYDVKRSFLLFATTNPHWNPWSRLISVDECTLMGYPSRKVTYFAPVIRASKYMRATNKEFPIHRVLELKKEFNHVWCLNGNK